MGLASVAGDSRMGVPGAQGGMIAVNDGMFGSDLELEEGSNEKGGPSSDLELEEGSNEKGGPSHGGDREIGAEVNMRAMAEKTELPDGEQAELAEKMMLAKKHPA